MAGQGDGGPLKRTKGRGQKGEELGMSRWQIEADQLMVGVSASLLSLGERHTHVLLPPSLFSSFLPCPHTDIWP